jgi:hypothetical protein
MNLTGLAEIQHSAPSLIFNYMHVGGGTRGGLFYTRALVEGRYHGTPGALPIYSISHLLGNHKPKNVNNKSCRRTKAKLRTAKGIRGGHFLGENAYCK